MPFKEGYEPWGVLARCVISAYAYGVQGRSKGAAAYVEGHNIRTAVLPYCTAVP